MNRFGAPFSGVGALWEILDPPLYSSDTGYNCTNLLYSSYLGLVWIQPQSNVDGEMS